MEGSRAGIIRKVEWREIFPWLRLIQAAAVAVGLRVWIAAIAGLVLTECGRQVLEYAFPAGEHLPALPRGTVPVPEGFSSMPWQTRLTSQASGVAEGNRDASSSFLTNWLGQAYLVPVIGVWSDLSQCFTAFFRIDGSMDQPGTSGEGSPQRSWSEWLKRLLYFTWVFGVWSLWGGAIIRAAGLAIARDEWPGLGELLRFVLPRWRSMLLCVLSGLIAIYGAGWLSAIACLLAEWLRQHVIPVGWLWALTAPVAIGLAGIVVAIVGGWPFMMAAIVIDGQDHYGAIGAAAAYVFRRPLHLLFYTAVAAVVGFVAATVVAIFLEWSITLTLWSARLAFPKGMFAGLLADQGAASWFDLFRQLTPAYIYGQFWTSVAVIYLLLRYHVDEADLQEIFVEEPSWGNSRGQ